MRLSELEERWRLDPSSRHFLQLAEELRKADRSSDAVTVLEEGLKFHPDSISAMVALGRCKLELDDASGATKALAQAVQRDPAQLVANKLLVEAHLRMGDASRAAQRLETYRLLNERDSEIEEFERRLRDLDAGDSDQTPFPLDRPGSRTLGIEWPEIAAAGEGSARQPFGDLALQQVEGMRRLARLNREGIFLLARLDAPSVSASPAASSTSPGRPEPVGSAAKLAGASSSEGEDGVGASAGAEVYSMRYIGEEVEREALAEPGPARIEEPGEGGAAPRGSATLASLYMRQGHLEEAEHEYRAVLEADPGDPVALTGLLEIERFRKGRETIEEASEAGSAALSPAKPEGLTQRKIGVLRRFLERVRELRAESAHVP